MDNIVIAKEIINLMSHRKRPLAEIKLDINKAYDILRWNFLSHSVLGLGFIPNSSL